MANFEILVDRILDVKDHPNADRLILKSVSPDFLLRKNGTEYN